MRGARPAVAWRGAAAACRGLGVRARPLTPPSPSPLSPQIGYSTVFFFEYFGPLVIYPVFFFFPQLFYPSYQCVACLGEPFRAVVATFFGRLARREPWR